MTFSKIVHSPDKKEEVEINERKEVLKLAKEMKFKFKKAKKQKEKQHYTSPYLHSPYYEEWSTLVNSEIDKDIDDLNKTKWNNLVNDMDHFMTLPHLYEHFIFAIEYYLNHSPDYLSVDDQMEYQFIIDYLDYEKPNLNSMADHYIPHRLDLLSKPITFFTQVKRAHGTYNEQMIVHELIRGYATLEFIIN